MTRTSAKTKINQAQVVGASVAADFQKDEFDILFRDKGYDVIHQKGIMCSCKAKHGDHLSDCQNCGGSGYIHVNPTRTRMIITSMQLDKEYDETARKDIGMAYISARHEDKLGHMDAVLIENALATHHEVLFPTIDSTFVRASTFYNIKEVEFIGQFIGQTAILNKLEEGTDYTFANNVIDFTPSFHEVTGTTTGADDLITLVDNDGLFINKGIEKDNVITNTTDGSTCKVLSVIDNTTINTTNLSGGTDNLWQTGDAYTITIDPKVSIRYRHNPLFYVWDAPREMLSSLLVKGAARRDSINLAVKAIAKRAHLIAGAENWSGNRLLDNSWQPDCPPSEPTKVETIIRNSPTSYIYEVMTPSQKAEIKEIACGLFGYTFDLSFD
jgi:hypothetical protein